MSLIRQVWRSALSFSFDCPLPRNACPSLWSVHFNISLTCTYMGRDAIFSCDGGGGAAPVAAAVKDHRTRPSVSQSVSPSDHPTDRPTGDRPQLRSVPTRLKPVPKMSSSRRWAGAQASVEHYQRSRARGRRQGAGGRETSGALRLTSDVALARPVGRLVRPPAPAVGDFVPRSRQFPSLLGRAETRADGETATTLDAGDSDGRRSL